MPAGARDADRGIFGCRSKRKDWPPDVRTANLRLRGEPRHERSTQQDHLFDDPRQQILRQAAGAGGHFAVLFLRCQDRGARAERLGQELAAAHPGRRGPGVRWTDRDLTRADRRLSRTGAPAGRIQDGAGGGGEGGARHRGAHRGVQPDQRKTGRAHVGSADEQDPRPAVGGPGKTRCVQRLGPRLAPRNGDGCPALPAGGHAREGGLRRRAPARGSVPAAAAATGHSAAGRADQPPGCRNRRLAGAPPSAVPGNGHRRDPRPLFPRQRRRLDPGA